MAARRTPGEDPPPTREQLDARFRADGLSPRWWSNAPGDTYGRHHHGYQKVLYCAEGTIVFHTDEGDVALEPGDRLDIEPGTAHSATVGRKGVTCVEASK